MAVSIFQPFLKIFDIGVVYVTFCRRSSVLLMRLLIAVPPEVQINTHKIVKVDDNSTATSAATIDINISGLPARNIFA